MMQALPAGSFKGPIACIRELVKRDGTSGLLPRLGSDATRASGVHLLLCDLRPDQGVSSQTALPRTAALLLSGAFAGAMAGFVYPVDVVKTQIQVEMDEGSQEETEAASRVMRSALARWGFWAFWDGLGQS